VVVVNSANSRRGSITGTDGIDTAAAAAAEDDADADSAGADADVDDVDDDAAVAVAAATAADAGACDWSISSYTFSVSFTALETTSLVLNFA
jgi:hypothetical protein